MHLPTSVTFVVDGVTIAMRADVGATEADMLAGRATEAESRALAGRPEERRAGFLTGRALIREVVAGFNRSAAAAGGGPGPGGLGGAGDGAGPVAVAVDAVCVDCGGPHGPTRVDGFQTSVTHLDGMTAVAMMSDADARTAGIEGIGLDVEPAPAGPERVAAIESLTGKRFGDAGRALRRWTEIEAALKADGRGLRVSPDAVSFDGDGAGGSIARITDRPGVVYEVHPVEVGDGFVMSLALGRAED